MRKEQGGADNWSEFTTVVFSLDWTTLLQLFVRSLNYMASKKRALVWSFLYQAELDFFYSTMEKENYLVTVEESIYMIWKKYNPWQELNIPPPAPEATHLAILMFQREQYGSGDLCSNALFSSERGNLQLVVVRRVEKEEAITVNYLDPYIYRWLVQSMFYP